MPHGGVSSRIKRVHNTPPVLGQRQNSKISSPFFSSQEGGPLEIIGTQDIWPTDNRETPLSQKAVTDGYDSGVLT